jgi:hypothetical protein
MYEISEPTPQDFGFPETPMPHQVEVWNRQELFLAAYAKVGKRGLAAKEAGITVWGVDNWVRTDVYSIKKRMALAHQRYVESLEQLMDDRLTNPTGNRGSDILLMFKLKAEAPEKYREEVKVLNVAAPIQMLDRLRELATRERKAQEALESPAVEGEFREMPGSGSVPTPSEGDAHRRSGNPGPIVERSAKLGTEHPVDTRVSPPEPLKKLVKQRRQVKKR